MDADLNRPLINASSASEAQLSRLSSTAITVLGSAKVLLGVSCVIAPQLTGTLFLLHISNDAIIITQMFGSSVAGLGAVLWMLSRRVKLGRGLNNAELQLALIFNIVVDTMDMVSCTVAFLTGLMRISCFGLLGGGCAILAALGVLGLWNL